jgi:hypothetical protein
MIAAAGAALSYVDYLRERAQEKVSPEDPVVTSTHDQSAEDDWIQTVADEVVRWVRHNDVPGLVFTALRQSQALDSKLMHRLPFIRSRTS